MLELSGGSEKQNVWATEIRTAALRQIENPPARLAEGTAKTLALIESKTDARWWIETGRAVQWAAVVRAFQRGEPVKL